MLNIMQTTLEHVLTLQNYQSGNTLEKKKQV